jgi:superfamily I DNA/RNA helicase
MQARVWTSHQKKIFGCAATQKNNLAIRARAGTGKTTTLIEILTHLPNIGATLLCAFSSAVQEELRKYAPEKVHVKTLHALGLAICKKYLGSKVDLDKTRRIAYGLADSVRLRYVSRRLLRLTSLCKNMCKTTPAEILEVCRQYDIGSQYVVDEKLAELAAVVLQRSMQESDTIDYDDMLWFPSVMGMGFPKYDHVLVDEVQDLNEAQRRIVLGMAERGARTFIVGDDRQAIYIWRGARFNMFDTLVQDLRAEVLSLPTSFRCARQIVERSKEFVPDFEHAAAAEEGTVLEIQEWEMDPKPGDFILSRTNVALVQRCVALMSKDVPVAILGKSYGGELLELIKRSGAHCIEALQLYLRDLLRQEQRRLSASQPHVFAAVSDKIATLSAFCYFFDDLKVVEDRIHRLFSDVLPENVVTCSTIHRAKGLERDRVWLLIYTFNSKREKTVEEEQEELNLKYVGMTRARSELYLVDADDAPHVD